MVDANLRAHDHENLYVVGKSTFPSIGFANPTLTVMALGARLGDHLSDNAMQARRDKLSRLRKIAETPRGLSPSSSPLADQL